MKNIANLFHNFQINMNNNLNVLMIGKITSYNATNNTATIEPMHYFPTTEKPYTPLINVPIGCFNIGGYNIKIKPKINDIMLIMFTDYDIDNLLIDSKTKKPNTSRTHALEDAIALPLSINFLNNSFNATEDLTIAKEGTNTYVKIKSNGDIILNSSTIKLGENATKRVMLENGNSYTTSSKVYAE
ncbi:Gp138 family membrane-puncturing spike protein [Clostridium haemolyticum]|uniref:Phage protein Gp138 N-terminal domain-containing protein n=1 Tax=Clostridium haemolyticum NCTC 9693 TaxID=1443114 RepID=A0ABR4THZ6_CLOHA|nr:Gp138 family membrane-puncturing spike protein [Clostridium haemolyticum]KEI18246.1 hypothetical protein Z960_03745 [Clostridium haemolyticum NCTC 9693]KGN04167.1 hypothetical protein Z961_04240 [Clostridium haemolyticum NCTC 8350]